MNVLFKPKEKVAQQVIMIPTKVIIPNKSQPRTEFNENALDVLGAELEKVLEYKLPNGDPRRLVIIKKVRPTPTKYPRSSANIKKKPL